MALTCYCKKCGRDVPKGDRCPQCGGKLSPTQARVAWCVDCLPVRDWMCWNAALRVALPVWISVLALALLLQGLTAGLAGVADLLRRGLLLVMGLLLAGTLTCLLLLLILQGEEVLDCVVDAQGVHVQRYLPRPTALKLLCRGKSPALLKTLAPDEEQPLLLVGQRSLAWRQVARLQLWPQKRMALLYAPRWWVRVWLPCAGDAWDDALAFMAEKLGKQKHTCMPAELQMQIKSGKR